MKSLQFNENSQGYLVLSDLETDQLYYPSDATGTFLNVPASQYQSIQFVSNGSDIFPVNFIGEGQLGWIANAITAVASIGSSIVGNRTSKKANESAEKQLQTQQQIALLNAQSAERQAALLNQKKGLSTGAIVGIVIAGSAIVGAVLYLVSTSNKEKTLADKKLEGVKSSTKSIKKPVK